jgi:hypothetical protein
MNRRGNNYGINICMNSNHINRQTMIERCVEIIVIISYLSFISSLTFKHIFKKFKTRLWVKKVLKKIEFFEFG